MYDENVAIFPSKYQEIGCKICDGIESSGNLLSFKIAGNSVFRRPSNHQTEAQCPGQPTLPFTPRDAERNRSIIQWRCTFDAVKTAVLSSPIEVDGAVEVTELQQANALWHYGNVWEGNLVSRPAISSRFWTNSSSRWLCSNTFFVNEIDKNIYINCIYLTI